MLYNKNVLKKADPAVDGIRKIPKCLRRRQKFLFNQADPFRKNRMHVTARAEI